MKSNDWLFRLWLIHDLMTNTVFFSVGVAMTDYGSSVIDPDTTSVEQEKLDGESCLFYYCFMIFYKTFMFMFI